MTPEEFLKTTGTTHEVSEPLVVYPKGVEASVKFTGNSGIATQVVPAGEDPRWDEYLRAAGFGDQVEILRVTQVRAWQQKAKGEDTIWLRYLRAEVVIRRHAEDQLDIDMLCERVSMHEPVKKSVQPGTQIALVVNFADMQTGKRDGEGTKGLVKAFLSVIDSIRNRIRQLEAIGYSVARLYLIGMGDLVEGCDGFYLMQAFSVELHRRDQCKLVRRLFTQVIQILATEVPEIVVGTVGGNHGEHRKDGKAFTWWGDNDDVAVIEQVSEIFAANPGAYGHVSFVIPRDEMTLCLDVLGTPVAFAHGHQWRGNKIFNAIDWWKDARFSDHPIAGARVLVAAHRHHAALKARGRRTFMQCPPLESESTWWKERGGGVSPAGVLSFACGPHWPMGWGELEILS